MRVNRIQLQLVRVKAHSHSVSTSVFAFSKTRMHSSRMRTSRSLTVCWHLLPGGVVCLVRGGLPGLGGVSAWSPGGGVLGPGGACSQGGCLPGPGVSAWSGGGLASQHALRQTPSPPVDRITDACKNITLAQLRCGR